MTHGVKYIGSKRLLIPYILDIVKDIPIGSMLDPFTGTTRVSQAFRKAGWNVCAGDLSWASEAYAALFLMTTPKDVETLQSLVDELNTLEGKEGWITQSYCDVQGQGGGIVRVWKPKNGRKADSIREKIDEWLTSGRIDRLMSLRLVALLILAMDSVDNTVGVQQAYLKDWAIRTDNDLRLTIPSDITEGQIGTFIPGSCLEVVYPNSTLAYLDPPYSSHSYATYYHIWDSIARWDKPEICLKTNRRKDRTAGHFDESMKSPWNSKKEVAKAFQSLMDRLPVEYILLSYSNESLLSLQDLEPILKKYKSYDIREIDYKRNIMSRIGNASLYDTERNDANIEYLILIEK
jgi:adenine-specific DNA-methyltransferase